MLLKNLQKIAIWGIIFVSLNCGTTFAQDSSANGQLKILETQVYGETYDNDTTIQRIERLELKTFNETQQGALFERISNIKNSVNGSQEAENAPMGKDNSDIPGLIQEYKSGIKKNKSNNDNKIPDPASPATTPQQKTSNNSSNEEKLPQFDPESLSYLDAVKYVNQNKVIRWKKMPLKIFLPAGNNLTYFPEYRPAVIRALDIWKVKTNGAIDYVLVDNQKKADVIVVWQDSFPEDEHIGGQASISAGYNQRQNVAGNLISTGSMFAPGYLGYGASLIGAIVGGLGNLTPKIRDVKLRIGTMPAMRLEKKAAVDLIQSVTAHEFGHILGLSAHSNNPEDVMYQSITASSGIAKLPSKRDITTITQLYQLKPDITN
jgi:predicted Zn-dependent protease